jgi:hypothetical protein
MRCYPMPGRGLATLWRDVTEQKRAEEARHYLARASEILAGSLDRDEAARQLARLLVPRLADWCSIQLLDEAGALRQVAVAHADPAKVAWAEALNERYPADPESRTGAHEVVRTGQPLLFARSRTRSSWPPPRTRSTCASCARSASPRRSPCRSSRAGT